jgi:antitoxin ParD1/3/4
MPATKQLVVDLPTELVDTLEAIVRSGDFASESELVGTILQAWHAADHLDEEELNEVRAAVSEGLADAEAGRFVDADEMFDRLRARYRAMIPDRAGG